MYASFNARAIGRTLNAETTVDLAASAGFPGVDLLVRDLQESGADPLVLRRRMDDLGLRGGAWPLPVDWRGDAERFAADLEALPRLADLAATLALTRTGTWLLPGLPPAPPGIDLADHRRSVVDRHVERLTAIARVLNAAGTRLGLEVIGVESSRTGSLEPLYARLGSDAVGELLDTLRQEVPGVGLLIDTFHLQAAGEPWEVGWSRPIEDVVWIHLADVPEAVREDRRTILDAERELAGVVEFETTREFLLRLRGQGYDGPVTAEPMGKCRSLTGLSIESAARRVRESLRHVWPNPL